MLLLLLLSILLILSILLLECSCNDQRDRIIHHHHEIVKQHKIARIENNYHTGNLTIIPPHLIDEAYNLRFPTGLNKHGGWAQADQVLIYLNLLLLFIIYYYIYIYRIYVHLIY